MKAEIKFVTPAVASGLLTLNTNNRPLCNDRVALYAEKMRSGLWMENGESIVITDKPRLGSGQHRLCAIVRSGIGYNIVIVSGVSDRAFPTLDTGKSRTAANVMTCAGIKNAGKTAAALSAIVNYQGSCSSAWSDVKGADTISGYHGTYGDITEFISLSERIRASCKARSSFLAGALYWMNASNRNLMLDFAEKMSTGIGLVPGDPELMLRARISADAGAKARLSKVEYAALVAVAANAKLNSKTVRTLKWDNSSAFPQIRPE
jgi:hypothetical protein